LCLPFNIILSSASSSSKLSLCVNFLSLPCMSRSAHNFLILYPRYAYFIKHTLFHKPSAIRSFLQHF
jgi:hypothetical protein